MADSLYDLLIPYAETQEKRIGGDLSSSQSPWQSSSPSTDQISAKYLARLSTLSLEALTDTEPQSLSQLSQSNLVSLQALSNRSHKCFVSSADHLSSFRTSIPELAEATRALRDGIPGLDDAAVRFSSTYNKTVENPILDRRKKSMQLLRNIDRMSDIMELPTLLSTVVSSASANPQANPTAGSTGSSALNNSYSLALDLLAHIKKLQTLYPDSPLVKDVTRQAEDAMREMTTNLIGALRGKNIRLAAAMRTIGWLRRVAPELGSASSDNPSGPVAGEGMYGALFIVCRLANLILMLEALDPLRELADAETQQRLQGTAIHQRGLAGQQTERYLKRYIEVFREQSFAIISLYKNIFAPASAQNDVPASADSPTIDLKKIGLQSNNAQGGHQDSLPRLPPALSTFPMYLTQLLVDTLREYLPNVVDHNSRESLLTQVLYCSGSLGRLGANFSLHLAFIDDDDDDEEDDDIKDEVAEWEAIMKIHRALAARLDKMTTGGTDSLKPSPRSISPAR